MCVSASGTVGFDAELDTSVFRTSVADSQLSTLQPDVRVKLTRSHASLTHLRSGGCRSGGQRRAARRLGTLGGGRLARRRGLPLAPASSFHPPCAPGVRDTPSGLPWAASWCSHSGSRAVGYVHACEIPLASVSASVSLGAVPWESPFALSCRTSPVASTKCVSPEWEVGCPNGLLRGPRASHGTSVETHRILHAA
jgi:hypothetical protein